MGKRELERGEVGEKKKNTSGRFEVEKVRKSHKSKN